MLTIDGVDGGGQLLRTALSLSVVTETPFRMENVRGSRPQPGLRPQHLAAVDLVAELCGAAVEGAELDADSLTFRPGTERLTDLQTDIGTAGSVTLLFDTVLPITATSEDPLELRATGGTNVKWAPTVEYQQFVKLPLLATWGVDATVNLLETGFYPGGGGTAMLQTVSSSLSPIELESRGPIDRVEIFSKASEGLAERDVADRQATHAQETLEEAGFDTDIRSIEYVTSRSVGSSLLLRGVYDHSVIGVDALGERGVTSEAVADSAVDQFTDIHACGAAVDTHMADQLMVFLALSGGRLHILEVTPHVAANLDLLNTFGSDMTLERLCDGTLTVVASPHPLL